MSLRNRVNDTVGRYLSRRSLRRAYASRELLIPNQWDGSVQQFYHFFLGYLLPLSTWVRKNPHQPVAVRDCGPMNVWLELIGESVDLEIMSTGFALHALAGDHMSHTVLKTLDNPDEFDFRNIVQSREDFLQIVCHESANLLWSKIVIIDRASSEDFYHSPASETHMSGQERRSVPNLRELPRYLGSKPEVEVVDLARMAPLEQISLIQSCNVLVGQHGAGLAHMVWMKPGSTVIEIAPPLPSQVIEIFSRLSSVLGLRYRRIEQNEVHAPIDLESLSKVVHESDR